MTALGYGVQLSTEDKHDMQHAVAQLPPHPDVRAALDQLRAAHAWDVAGASHAGCRTAFVERRDKVLDPEGREPTYGGGSMAEIVNRITNQEQRPASG